ncbi:hypothetical protein PPOLYM_03442 [Paenibacillus polymyxa]|nr:hypothetical protein PPOLYM_03442 [Paenibacillus polymyxa]
MSGKHTNNREDDLSEDRAKSILEKNKRRGNFHDSTG